MASCLIVEDNVVNAVSMQQGMLDMQFVVQVAHDGEQALDLTDQCSYDVILLDLELPKIHGLTVLRQLRRNGVQTPVIIVSAHATIADRVQALRAGADDYVCKPFHPEELLARVRAKIRRSKKQVLHLRVADLELDPFTHSVRRGGTPIHLCSKEFAVLEYLMRNAGCPLSRDMIIANIWDGNFDGASNFLDVRISNLRRKIDRGYNKPLICTVPGIGYAIKDPDIRDAES